MKQNFEILGFKFALTSKLILIGQLNSMGLNCNTFMITVEVLKNGKKRKIAFNYEDTPINYTNKVTELPELFTPLKNFIDRSVYGKMPFSVYCSEDGLVGGEDDFKLWNLYRKKYYSKFKSTFTFEPEIFQRIMEEESINYFLTG